MKPTNDVGVYLAAATRENTRRSYQGAVRHFEVEWGGFLPATANSLARYLAHYAGSLAVNTLQQRMAALAQWHIDQGFPDPTKSPVVRKVLKGFARCTRSRKSAHGHSSLNRSATLSGGSTRPSPSPQRCRTMLRSCVTSVTKRCCCWVSGAVFVATN